MCKVKQQVREGHFECKSRYKNSRKEQEEFETFEVSLRFEFNFCVRQRTTNMNMISPSHQQWRTIISIKKQVEESGDKETVRRKHSPTNNEATKSQHLVTTRNAAEQNIMLRDEEAQEAASVSTLLSSESDEKSNHHVLKINIQPASAKAVNKRRMRTSNTAINQDHSVPSAAMMNQKPFDGNLSDDQKLVLSVVSDGGACEMKNQKDIKIINGNMKASLFDGKCSPYDDHSDSGTCSDAEVILFQSSSESPQPPPVPPKSMRAMRQQHQMLSDSYSSASSSDSAQHNENLSSIITLTGSHLVSPDLIRSIDDHHKSSKVDHVALLPSSLLIDIRSHSVNFLQDQDKSSSDEHDEQESSYGDSEPCNRDSADEKLLMNCYSDDTFYKFHINEHLSYELDSCKLMTHDESDESFAGLKDLRSGTSTIRSAKGTIRGVKNRVRNGIATFLQMQQTTVKNYKDRDGGKVVLYTTSMGIVRSTYTKCQTVKKILNTLMVKYEERDVFMSHVHQQEIRERMEMDEIDVPHLFLDGQYIGNADQVERFNEMGELRKMLKTFKCLDTIRTCRICGGFNMLPCSSCGGSKKSIHRNSFTSEFIALKCMNCDEVGLVRCYNCS